MNRRSVCWVLSACGAAILAGCGRPEARDVFDVPRLDGLSIDGRADDWGDRGFRVTVMAYAQQPTPDAADFASSLHVGWSDAGLLLLVRVRDEALTEHPGKRMWEMDGVDIFTGRPGQTDRWYQVLACPGSDGERAASLLELHDRSDKPAVEMAVRVASGRTPDGYVIEALLPWENLAARPAAGDEVGLMLFVHDVDQPGQKPEVQQWAAGSGAWNPQRFHRLRLAARASPPVCLLAVGRYENLVRGRIDVVADEDLAGQAVEVRDGSRVLARGPLTKQAGRAEAILTVPMPPPGRSYPPLAVTLGGRSAATVALGDADAARRRAFEEAPLRYRAVFVGAALPKFELENPGWIETLVGPCTVRATYYDADYREVTSADRPGRYGAVVEIAPPDARPVRRFVTLYRQPSDLKWWQWEWTEFQGDLPPELGIDPAVVRTQRRTLAAHLRTCFFETARDDSQAVLLAGLHETAPTDPPAVERTNPPSRNERWWFGLKQKLGLAETRYLLFLPKDYEKDPAKRWPLVLFLHGAGERGDDLAKVKVHGPPNQAAAGRDFPFILVAPQCPVGRWWSPVELGALLDKIEKECRVDADRVYVTGLSMGGFGTWALACECPDRFAAIAPICGGGDPPDAERIRRLPVWAFHGAKDTVVPPERSQEMVEALKGLGAPAALTLYPDAGHDSWSATYRDDRLYDWLLANRRGRPPAPPPADAPAGN